jgi:plastocyanin
MTGMRPSNRSLWILSAAITAIALVVACGDDSSSNRKRIRSGGGESGAPSAAAPTAAGGDLKKFDPASGGTITGVIKYDGTPPAPRGIDLTPECAKAYPTEQIFYEDLVVKDGKVQFAFLYVDVKDSYAPPAEAAMIDQHGCQYRPHVIGIQAGQKIDIKSSDPFLHNAHYIGKVNGENNLAMTKPGTRQLTFEAEEGMLKFKCDVHPFMGAWVGIMKHPFFATSAEDGTFTIKGVPPGEYDLVMHHEKQGSDQRVKVKVEQGKTVTQDFTLKK